MNRLSTIFLIPALMLALLSEAKDIDNKQQSLIRLDSSLMASDSLQETSIPVDNALVGSDTIQGIDVASQSSQPLTALDSLYIARLHKLATVIELPYNPIVRNYIELYCKRIKEKTERILGLSQYYFPLYEEIFDRYDMPLEFKYLSVIESALNPRATSCVGAAGLWQFMYQTGRMYGLKVSSTVDLRRDPIVSTDAAARHLKDLYRQYNDWTLVIAAYNCGSGNVNKAIRRSGRTDFWGIYDYLPRETRGYVPAFIGATYAMNYYKEHGLTPTPSNFDNLLTYDTLHINRWVHFEQIAKVINIPVDTLRELNPQYRKDIIPGNESTYLLKLPQKYVPTFIAMQDSIFNYKSGISIPRAFASPSDRQQQDRQSASGDRLVHKVRSGETLSAIARKYGVSASNIKQWNRLRSQHLKKGQRLSIYASVAPLKSAANSANTVASAPAKAVKETSEAVQQTTASKGQSLPFITTVYKVRSGDTLSTIARKHDMTLDTLCRLNNISKRTKLIPGDKLIVAKK